MTEVYLLENGKPRLAIGDAEIREALLITSDQRHVEETKIGSAYVLTVFTTIATITQVGLHKRRVLLWETMVFGGEYGFGGPLWKHATLASAKRIHWLVVDALRAGIRLDAIN